MRRLRRKKHLATKNRIIVSNRPSRYRRPRALLVQPNTIPLPEFNLALQVPEGHPDKSLLLKLTQPMLSLQA